MSTGDLVSGEINLGLPFKAGEKKSFHGLVFTEILPTGKIGVISAELLGPVARVHSEYAEFFVRACNRDHAFDELVAAVAQAVDKDIGYFNEEARGITYKEVKALRAALAKARA